jgi:hypothetical protein
MLELLANQIAQILIDAIQKEFILQGHRLTGKLNASIESIVKITASGANILILMNDYGIIQNRGVGASRIPYNPNVRTGNKTSKYIQGLQNFARLRFGVTPKQALSIAFAIAKKHAKEGMPTKASSRFSKTGRRTGAIDEALAKSDKEIERLTLEFLEETIITNLAA